MRKNGTESECHRMITCDIVGHSDSGKPMIRFTPFEFSSEKEKYLEISRRFYIESKYNTTINNSMLQVGRSVLAMEICTCLTRHKTARQHVQPGKHASHRSHKPLTHIGSKIRGQIKFLINSHFSTILAQAEEQRELASKLRAKAVFTKTNS